jgi:membrane protein YdbS with pleckstrin-like domain
MSRLEGFVIRLCRTPPQPDPPTGAPDSLQAFRASRSYFHYQLLVWGARQLGTILAIVALLWFDSQYDIRSYLNGIPWFALPLIRAVEGIAIIGLLVQFPITLLLTQLDYRYRWYMTTDRSLRIREGIFTVKEQTMMFSNVQNVAVRQGPLQRLFGISDVEVRSAGGGGATEKSETGSSKKDDLHLGYFRGVANPAEIRDVILNHLRRLKDGGLGDPDEPSIARFNGSTLAAGRELLREAKALRNAIR